MWHCATHEWLIAIDNTRVKKGECVACHLILFLAPDWIPAHRSFSHFKLSVWFQIRENYTHLSRLFPFRNNGQTLKLCSIAHWMLSFDRTHEGFIFISEDEFVDPKHCLDCLSSESSKPKRPGIWLVNRKLDKMLLILTLSTNSVIFALQFVLHCTI